MESSARKPAERFIPATGIPVSHFLTMLKKDYIMWKRDSWKTAAEIFIPMLLFVLIGIIQWVIPDSKILFNQDVTLYQISTFPLPLELDISVVNDTSRLLPFAEDAKSYHEFYKA